MHEPHISVGPFDVGTTHNSAIGFDPSARPDQDWLRLIAFSPKSVSFLADVQTNEFNSVFRPRRTEHVKAAHPSRFVWI